MILTCKRRKLSELFIASENLRQSQNQFSPSQNARSKKRANVKSYLHQRRPSFLKLCRSIGYRLRWRSDIWSTNRGAAEVGTPDIRPTTEDDIRHNATTQDKDLLRIIMPLRFRFYFHYRMLRKKAKQPFEASSLNSSSCSRHRRCLFEYKL